MKTIYIFLLLLSVSFSCIAQKAEKPLEVITETLYPTFGKEDEIDVSHSKILSERYGIDFSFVKINNLDLGYCVFTDNENISMELKVGERFIALISKDRTKRIQVLYKSYQPNKKTPIAGAVVMEYSIYNRKK